MAICKLQNGHFLVEIGLYWSQFENCCKYVMWGIKFKYFDILNKYKLFSTLFEVTSHQKRSFVSFKMAIYWPKITINRAGYIFYTNN